MVPFAGNTRLAAGAPKADAFETGFVANLSSMNLNQVGSAVVADSLRRGAVGAMLNPKLSPAEREAKFLKAIEPMLGAGRGPALEALRLFSEASAKFGKALSPETRDALAAALFQVGEALIACPLPHRG